MVLGTEIVVDARHVEVAGDGHIQVARKSQNISASHRLWLQVAFDCGLVLVPYLRNQRVETEAKRITQPARGSGTAVIRRRKSCR